MLKPGVVKISAVVAGVIFICALIGVAVGFSIPTEKTENVIQVNYSHQGEFTYKAYSVSDLFSGQADQPNPVLFPQIIKEMEILFSSSGTGVMEMKVILADRNESWQKEIPIQAATENSTVSFPLNLDEILSFGETINAAVGRRGSDYLLKIIAKENTGRDSFVAILEGELNPVTLEWEEEGFNKAERGFPGRDNWRQASFGYRVELKRNNPFGPTTLERKPRLPEMSTIEPDFSLFTDLVESLDIGFDYRFESDVPIDSLVKEVEAWIVIEEPGRWQRSFTLLSPTKKQNEVALNFPLDISKLREIARAVNEEIGRGGAGEQEITIFVQVHTIAETSYGIIDEIFEHQLKGKMAEKIAWGLRGEDLTVTTEGTIAQEITELNPISQTLRKFSLISFGVSFPIFCALAFLYWKKHWKKTKPSFLEEELRRNKKKHGDLISEISDSLPISEETVIIRASSLEDLASISNNSLKPILLKIEPDRHSYYVVDGLLRYEYVRKG